MRRFTALINPISGGGRAGQVWQPIARALAEAGAAVTELRTRGREHAMTEAARAAEAGDVVVAVGGDGLARDAAGGAGVHGGTIAIVPGGRGNDLAASLGVPTDPGELATMLLTGPRRGLDLLDVNGVLAPGNVYIGIDSVATRLINKYRRVPARLLYRLAPVGAILTWRAPEYTLDLDGAKRRVRAHTVIAANSGRYGHGLDIVPPAVVDDGLAHVMVVGDGPRRAIVRFMNAAKRGEHVVRSEVDITTAETITVDADRPVPVCADGDEVTTLPAVIRLRRHAIGVITP